MNKQDINYISEAYDQDVGERLGSLLFKSPDVSKVISRDVQDTIHDVLNFIDSGEIPVQVREKLAQYLTSSDFDRSQAAAEIGKLYEVR